MHNKHTNSCMHMKEHKLTFVLKYFFTFIGEKMIKRTNFKRDKLSENGTWKSDIYSTHK